VRAKVIVEAARAIMIVKVKMKKEREEEEPKEGIFRNTPNYNSSNPDCNPPWSVSIDYHHTCMRKS
jgi:hypothetical protein